MLPDARLTHAEQTRALWSLPHSSVTHAASSLSRSHALLRWADKR